MAFVAVVAQAELQWDAKGAVHRGFVEVRPTRELYVEYRPAQGGQPTVILLNGMTYSTTHYASLVRPLVDRGYGVVSFDFDGMGKSLLRYAPSTEAYSYKTQITDTRHLLTFLKLKPPYNFVGLSYGGGIGIGYALDYPQEVKNLILISPYTLPLAAQDDWIRSQIWATRQMYPWNKTSEDELYDYFLHQIVYATYPQAEPTVLENPFKLEAVYNLARGIRKFRPQDHAGQLRDGIVHLMVAGGDQYIPRPVLEDFWQGLSPKARQSKILVQNVEHKINEAAPRFTAAWIAEILQGNPLLSQGRSFEGDPYSGVVRSEKDEIRIGKE